MAVVPARIRPFSTVKSVSARRIVPERRGTRSQTSRDRPKAHFFRADRQVRCHHCAGMDLLDAPGCLGRSDVSTVTAHRKAQAEYLWSRPIRPNARTSSAGAAPPGRKTRYLRLVRHEVDRLALPHTHASRCCGASGVVVGTAQSRYHQASDVGGLRQGIGRVWHKFHNMQRRKTFRHACARRPGEGRRPDSPSASAPRRRSYRPAAQQAGLVRQHFRNTADRVATAGVPQASASISARACPRVETASRRCGAAQLVAKRLTVEMAGEHGPVAEAQLCDPGLEVAARSPSPAIVAWAASGRRAPRAGCRTPCSAAAARGSDAPRLGAGRPGHQKSISAPLGILCSRSSGAPYSRSRSGEFARDHGHGIGRGQEAPAAGRASPPSAPGGRRRGPTAPVGNGRPASARRDRPLPRSENAGSPRRAVACPGAGRAAAASAPPRAARPAPAGPRAPRRLRGRAGLRFAPRPDPPRRGRSHARAILLPERSIIRCTPPRSDRGVADTSSTRIRLIRPFLTRVPCPRNPQARPRPSLIRSRPERTNRSAFRP